MIINNVSEFSPDDKGVPSLIHVMEETGTSVTTNSKSPRHVKLRSDFLLFCLFDEAYILH